MRKLLKSMKTLLAVALLCVGTNRAWGATSTWNYSTTLSNNTIGSSFEGSTSGIVSVQLGADGDGANWKVLNTNNNNRGLVHNDNSVTLTDNVPTAGTFVKVTANQKVQFVMKFYRAGTGYFRLIDESAPSTNILNERNGGSGGNKTATATLTAGHTYYIYYNEDSAGEGNFSIQGFTATTFATYTINYTYGGNIIKSEAEAEGYEGQKVTASLTSMWDDGSTTKYYVADNATTEFTVADGTNNFEVALRLAATDAVATVNAVDADGTVLKSFTATGVEGEVKDFIYYTRAVYFNGKYYAVNANNGNGRNYAKADVVYGGEPATVTYTLDESITYYAEAENLQISHSYAASGNANERASGGDWKRLFKNSYAYTKSGDLTAGVYTLEVSSRNQGSKSESLTIEVRNSDKTIYNTIGTLEWGSSNNSVQTKNFILVPSNCSVAIDNTTEYNSNIGIDYIILRKLYDVTDASKVIGAVDYSTAYGSSIGGAIHKDLSISKGEKMKINFQNHGSAANNYNNWALRIVNSTASFDRTLSACNHINGENAYDNVTQVFELDGSVVTFENFMADYKTQMKDANVDMTITYTTDGMFSVIAEATGADHTYKYTMTYGVVFTDDITMELGVDCAWLEVLSESIVAEITAAAGAATFVSNHALDFTDVEGLQAYIATEQNGSSITFDKVTGAVPAGTPLLLRGATADIPVAANAEELESTNLLVAGTGEAVASEDNGQYNFILNKIDDVVGFYKAAGQTVASNRAYLSLSDNPFVGGAKSVTMVFNDETTGITTVAAPANKAVVKGTYNMQGQRVQNPSKGLYIVDGKKVAIN